MSLTLFSYTSTRHPHHWYLRKPVFSRVGRYPPGQTWFCPSSWWPFLQGRPLPQPSAPSHTCPRSRSESTVDLFLQETMLISLEALSANLGAHLLSNLTSLSEKKTPGTLNKPGWTSRHVTELALLVPETGMPRRPQPVVNCGSWTGLVPAQA